MVRAMNLPIEDLTARIKASSQRQVAKDIGVSRAYLHDLLSGRRGLGDKVLKALGIRVRYEYIDKAKREAHERAKGARK